MDNITFRESLDIYRPIYFHFLDGQIDPNIGFDKDRKINFIINNNIITESNNKINLMTINDMNYDIFNFSLSVWNLHTKIRSEIIFDLYNLKKSIREHYTKLIEIFHYCIIPISNDAHATSIVICIIKNALYFLSFNSGAGIQNHTSTTSITESQDKYYEPYMGIKICDLDNTEKEKEKEKEKDIDNLVIVFRLLLVDRVYKILKDPSILNILIKENTYSEAYMGVYFDKLIYIIDQIKELTTSKSNLFSNIIINTKNNNINLSSIDLTSTDRKDFIKKNLFYKKEVKESQHITYYENINETDHSNYDNKAMYIILYTEFYGFNNINNNYYDLLKQVIDLTKCEKINLTSLINFNLDRILADNLYLLNKQTQSININSSIFKKLFFHTTKPDTSIYIINQESGSCSWFSLYWPSLFYNIISEPVVHTADTADTADTSDIVDIANTIRTNNYINFIINTNTIISNIIKKIFTRENFKIEYEISLSDPTKKSMFLLMKQLCDKFINIGILDKDILNNEIDWIYNTKFKINFNDLSRDTTPTIKYENTVNTVNNIQSYIDNLNNILSKGNIDYNLVYFINNSLGINKEQTIDDSNSIFIYAYTIFTKLNSESYNLFATSYPKIDKSVKVILTDINKILQTEKTILVATITKQISDQITIINKLLTQFENSYIEKHNAVYFSYIQWAIYIYNFHGINISDNNIELLKFILFAYRLHLFILIINNINLIILI